MACILVVDDEETITKTVGQLLTIKGHDVLCAENGKEALKIIDSQAIDLVITDIIMPDIDGYELIRTLRKRPDSPKIIAMSGGTFSQESGGLLNTAQLMGANKILRKPFDSASLNNAIQQVLGIGSH